MTEKITHKESLEISEKIIQYKESFHTVVPIFQFKEEDGELYMEGFVATSHLDKGYYDSKKEKRVRDTIPKETLQSMADRINDPARNALKITYRHEQEKKEVAGVGVRGSAKVMSLGVNPKTQKEEFGLWAKTRVNPTYHNYQKVKQEIKSDILDSFSIEYAVEDVDGNPLPDAVSYEDKGEYIERTFRPGMYFKGWTMAAEPMNEYTVAVKEIYSQTKIQDKQISNEVNMMAEETQSQETIELLQKEMKELKASIQAQEKEKQEMSQAEKEAADKKKAEEDKKKQMEDMKKEIVDQVLQSKEFSDKLDSKAENPKMENKEEVVQLKEHESDYVAVMQDKEIGTFGKLTAACNYAFKEGLVQKGTGTVEERLEKGFKHAQFNGLKIQGKSLGLSDNLAGSSSASALAAHRHADLVEVLDPVIYNLLNDTVSAYDFLRKINKTGGSDHSTFVVRAGRNPTAGAYSGNEVTTGKANRYKYSTKFKKYKVGFAVDGDLIAANRGAPQGDVLASEIEAATLDLKKEINTDLYTEQGLESSTKVIGFEFVADGEGNATMYGETRSEANGLKYATADAANSYASGATGDIKDLLRTNIRNVLVDGGSANGIVIFANPLQVQRIKNAEDNSLRYDPGASNIGFARNLTFEGYRIVEDVDCPEAKIFVIDTSMTELHFWVPPTVEMLGKRSDSSEGFIKTYLSAVYKAPRRVTMIHSVPTTIA